MQCFDVQECTFLSKVTTLPPHFGNIRQALKQTQHQLTSLALLICTNAIYTNPTTAIFPNLITSLADPTLLLTVCLVTSHHYGPPCSHTFLCSFHSLHFFRSGHHQKRLVLQLSPHCCANSCCSVTMGSTSSNNCIVYTDELALDPFLQTILEKIPILQVFSHQIFSGELSAKGHLVWTYSAEDYIWTVFWMFLALGAQDPCFTLTCKIYFYIQCLEVAWKQKDPLALHVTPIPI